MGVPKTSDGRPILSPTFEDSYGLTPIWRGALHTTAAGAINIFDTIISTEIRLRGGWYEMMAAGEAALGDFIEFAIVDKDDVLGYFGYFGIPPGGVLELKKYVRNEYVNPSLVGQRQEFSAGGVFQVMAGLYFRTIYHSTGLVPVHLKTQIFAYE